MILPRKKASLLSLKNNTSAFLIFLIIWTVISLFVKSEFIPTPLEIIKNSEKLINADFFINFKATILRLLLGFAISFISALIISLIAHCFKVRIILETTLSLIQVIPGIVLGIIFLILFGIGNTTPVMLIIVMVTPVMTINNLNAFSGIDHNLEDVVKVFGGGNYDIFSNVWIPAILPSIKSNLIIGSGLALKIIVLGEFLGSENGIGKLLNDARIYFNMNEMFFYLVVIVFTAFIFQLIIHLLFVHLDHKYSDR